MLLVFGMSAPFSSYAQQAELSADDNAFTVKGFGTLGVARSTNPHADILRSIRQPKGIGNNWSAAMDSLLGLQASYRFNDKVEAVIQGVSYYQDNDSFRPDVTAAFVKFNLDPNFSLRLGRVGLDLLMLADTRMVGYSYIPIRSANEFYSVPANYVDGADARLRWPLGDGVLRIEGTAGIARENLPSYKFQGSTVMKGTLGYDIGSWQFRYFYTQAKLANENETLIPLRNGLTLAGVPNVASSLVVKNTMSVYESLGIGYDDGGWQMQAVLNMMRHDTSTLENGRAAHVLLGRRLGSFTPYVGYSYAKTNPKSLSTGLPNLPWFAPLNAGVARAMSISHMDSKTTTLGLRWDFRRNMDVKAQVDFLRASNQMSPMITNVDPEWNGRTTMFSLSFDFIF